MTSSLKQRLVGAFVLAAIAVIFLPSFVKENQPYRVDTTSRIPAQPAIAPLRFQEPEQIDDIEPAPPPETMFLSADEQQPIVDSLDELPGPEPVSAPEPIPEPVTQPASSVSASSAPGRAEIPQAWVVQVASLTSAEAAIRLRDRLQAEGHKAYVRSASTANGEVSRVFIGPKIDRQEALEVKADVDKLLKVESLVVRFKP